MNRIDLQLTLLEDLVVDERPATEGGHTGLDYLPGILLLGAAAARLYGQLSRADTYRLFHGGEVRVKTREIVYHLFKQRWAPLLPILQGLNGREMA